MNEDADAFIAARLRRVRVDDGPGIPDPLFERTSEQTDRHRLPVGQRVLSTSIPRSSTRMKAVWYFFRDSFSVYCPQARGARALDGLPETEPHATARTQSPNGHLEESKMRMRWILVSMLAMVIATSALAGQTPMVQNPANPPCKCVTMKASSTPANPSDVCTKDDVGGVCTLDWNVSVGRREQAFDAALNRARPNLAPRFVPPKADCGGPPTASCDWIAFLRSDNVYIGSPGTVGAGFLLLLSAVVATPSVPIPVPGWETILTLMPRAEEIGNTIAKGGAFSSEVAGGRVSAAFGCLRADMSPNIIAVVQNVRGRREGTCDSR
jgi:hypothetical protein